MQTIPVRAASKTGATFTSKINLLTATPQKKVDQIQRLNMNPRSRAAAAEMLNNGARSMINIAIGIAHSEFRPRSPSRRPNKGSRYYVTSFYLKPATQDSIGRMKVSWGNNAKTADGRSLAAIIEYGADPHKIRGASFGSGTGPAFQTGFMRFPYRPNSARTHPGSGSTAGSIGDWPIEFGEPGSEIARTKEVNHPGSPAFHIMKRAREAYLTKNRMSPGRRAHL